MSIFEKISTYLAQAILLEVAAYPKPGLVTRHFNGAHMDMSLITFAMSSVITSQAFRRMEIIGKTHKGTEKELFQAVRVIGIEMEEELLRTTKGVNTQRGILFVGGIVAAAAGFLSNKIHADVECIYEVVQKMTTGLVKSELGALDNKEVNTAGERLFQKYHITGIRGEVENGLHCVRKVGVPALEFAFAHNISINDALVHALISLMTCVEDSNVIWRTNYETLKTVQKKAKEILDKGSIFTSVGREAIEYFDHECIEKRISPGGAADLLSISIALYLLKNKEFPCNII
ncbi:MAG: triphosphoribosyl-dephospho-CoA synthase [Acidaminococcaceae bacterium]